MKTLSTTLGAVVLLMVATVTGAFAQCACSSQICISKQESALYLACVATEQGAGLQVRYTSSSTAVFNAVAKSQSTQFFTTCNGVSAPLLPALQGQNLFQTGAAVSSAVSTYAKASFMKRRGDAWASFETMTPAQCLTTAKTIP